MLNQRLDLLPSLEAKHTVKPAVSERSPDFEEFKESIIGRKEDFGIVTLRTALEEGKISREEYDLLHEVYTVQLEDDKKHLEDVVGVDLLTGLANNVEPKLNKLLRELSFTGEGRNTKISAVMVIVLDINKFKRFNEVPFNHDVGDQALIVFAERLRSVVKEWKDKIFRSHKFGDEFVIVLPIDTDKADFDKVFERVEREVNHELFFYAKNEEGSDVKLEITASMAYAVSQKEISAKDLITEADVKERKAKLESSQ